MRKYWKLIPVFAAVVLMLAGCGKGSQSAVSDSLTEGTLTKAEWIGMLGEGFGYNQPFEETARFSDVDAANEYYDQIQACAEWEVLTEQDKFEPDEKVTWEYAVQTAVRAIGTDNLESAGITVAEDEYVDFFGSNVADLSAVDLTGGLTAGDADLLITYARNYSFGLEPVERFEYTYNDGVYEVAADAITLRGDGMTAVVNDGTAYQAGDVIYVQPSQESAAYALRVTDASEGEISYTLAEVEDVYSELQISGSYDGMIISVEGADEGTDISYRNAPGAYLNCSAAPGRYDAVPGAYSAVNLTGRGQYRADPMKFSVNGNSVKFEQALGDNGNFEVTISNIKVKTDIDFGVIAGLKKAKATVTFDDKIEMSYTADHYARSINLGKVSVNIGSTPCAVEISLVLNIGVDGEAKLTYTSTVVGEISYKKGSGLSKDIDNQNPEFDFHAQVTVTVEPTAKADLRLVGRSIANIKVTTGVVAVATVDADLMGDMPTCIDIYLYVPLRWAVNEDGCVMTNISSKLKYSKTVWDSKSSPINKRFHFENGTETPDDLCTRGNEEAVETDKVDEEGQPYDEYKIFEFEEISFDSIDVVSTQIVLDEGGSLSIGFESLPDGYQAADLVYTVEDASVCSVSGGVVTAVGSGSTTVKISTSDGKYSTFIAVTVNGGYHDTSGFQSL